jgi:hypothetical protein
MSMPTIKSWVDLLREVFGAAEIDAALRQFGYLASEGGREIDTRKDKAERGFTLAEMVVLRPREEVKRGR